MSNNNDAELKIGADESGVKVGMENSVAAIEQSVARMEAIFTRFAQTIEGQVTATAAASNQMAVAAEEGAGRMQGALGGVMAKIDGMTAGLAKKFEPLTAAFAKVNAAMVAIGAVLAGGKAFGAAIEQSVQLTGEANRLSKALGISAEEASVLNIALGDIYSSGDEYLQVFQHFAKQLKSNEDGMQAMGLKTRDANGHLRDANDVFRESFAIVGQYKAGLDQNTAAQTFYGKSVAEAMKFQKLSEEGMEAARQKAAELGLTLTKEGAESTAAYRAAMNDVGDVMTGLKNAIGQAIMPVLTTLGEWFAGAGPTAVLVIRTAINSLATALIVLQNGFRTLFEVAKATLMHLTTPFMALADAIIHAVQGDFGGAKEALKGIPKVWDQAWADAERNIVASSQKAHDQIVALWSSGTPAADKPKGGNKTMGDFGKDKKDKPKETDWLGIWREELLQRIQLEEGFFRDSTALEAEFWAGKLALTKEGSKERRAVEKEIFEAYKKLAHDNLDVEIDDLKLRASLERAGGVERIQIAGQIAARLAEVYGDDSQQYRAALREMAQAAREHAAQQLQIEQAQAERRQAASLGEIEAEQQRLEARRALGEISAEQELAALAKLEERKYRIELDYARQRAELVQDDPVAYEQALAKIEAIERAHAQRIGKINTDLAKEQNALWASLGDRAASLWDKGLQAMMNGTLTWKNAFKAVLTELTSWFVVDVVGKKVKAWLAGEVAKTTATQTGSAARLAAEQTASSAGLLAQMGSVIKSIMNFAAEAFAGVFAALSGIPYVGPALAAAAAPAAMATVVGVAGQVSAAQGYDIPASVNPIVQTHAREMILPERYADVIRAMAEQGGGVAGAASSAAIHIHAGSDKDTLRVADLKKILRQMGRDFVDVRL